MMYKVQQAVMQYGQRTVLKIDSLEIKQGEIFALVGPSGAGKSTLLRLLGLLETPGSGEVTMHLNGKAISTQTATIEERRQVAMVFQRPFLMSCSVRANIGYGLKIRGRAATHAVDDVLKRVSLSHLADASARTLSGGEMQRVAVARCLVVEPRALLLDEPTANLDPYNVRLIENLVTEQNQRYNTTLVLVTHNIFQAQRLADRVGLMLDGQLIEVASTEEFFNNPQDERTRAFVSGDLVY